MHVASNGTPAQQFWLLAVSCAAAALWALFNLFRRLRRDRLVADTPLVHIRSAAQGYVRVVGHAAPAGTATAVAAAPLTGRPCLWWSYEIAVHERDSKGNAHWRSIESASSVELFKVSDGDASCLVGPVNAEITPTTHDVWYGAEPRPSGPPVPNRALWDSGGYRYTESLLAVGAELCVMGDLRSHSEIGNADAALAAKLKQWKSDQQALLARFDTNHDGHLDAAEWDAARAAARSEVEGQALAGPIARTSVITQPANGEPFLIAPANGVDLVKREQRYAALYFALGLLFVVVFVWAFKHARALV
jgi:hypothetical protein